MNLKFIYPLIGVASGIFIAVEWISPLSVTLISLGLGLILWLFFSFFSKDPLKAWRFAHLHSIWIVLIFAGIGSLDFYSLFESKVEDEFENKTFNFTAEIIDAYTLANGDRYKVKIKSISDSSHFLNCKNLLILLKTDGFSGSKGDIISFRAQPSPVSYSKNKSYAEKLRHQGVEYLASVRISDIKKIGESNSLFLYFEGWRDHLISLLENSSLDRKCSEFIISVLLGNKDFLSHDTRQTFNSAGLAHVLALSGMHVAIIFTIILVLLFPISLAGHTRLRKLLAILFIWIYVIITGGAFSTVRAAIMATLVVGAFFLERKYSALNALFAAAFIILLVNPFSLWDIGFQLSFLCVASIIIFTQKLNPVDHHAHSYIFKTINIALISIITTFSTWIIVAYYFKSIPLLFLPSNILLLPFLPIFLSAGLLYLVFLSFGVDLKLLSGFLDYFHKCFVNMADFLSVSGKATIYYQPQGISVILWLIAILFIAFSLHSQIRKNKRWHAIVASISMLASISLILFLEPSKEKSLKFIHSFTKIETLFSSGDFHTHLEFPRQNISSIRKEDYYILTVDRQINTDSLPILKNINHSKKFLIAGPSFQPEQIAELVSDNTFTKIILHSGVGKNKKAELLHLLDPSIWDSIYSLGDNGSLDFEL